MAAKITTEDFIARAREVHGDKYDYSEVVYVRMHDVVSISCPAHGAFKQKAYSHLQGKGCAACGQESSTAARKADPALQAQRVAEKYAGKFDTSPILATADCKDAVTLVCPEHGPFSTSINRLMHPMNKYGCPRCGVQTRITESKGKNTKSMDRFISDATAAHGDTYDYSLVEYVDGDTLVEIVCKTHGGFLQKPRVHIDGSGCPLCFRERHGDLFTLPVSEFVRRSIAVHGNKFSYEKVSFRKLTDRIVVTCREHGDFETTAAYHMSTTAYNRGGCPTCATAREPYAISFSEFVDRATALYGDTYTYSGYTKISANVTVACPSHGEVRQVAYVHLRGGGCPICSKSSLVSSEEISLFEALMPYVDVESGNRRIIAPQELDIVCHDKQFAVEYCGLYWHSEVKGVDRRYHLNKHNAAEKAGYRLFTVFSDEWRNHPEVVTSIILRYAGIGAPEKIGARKCAIEKVDHATVSGFYNQFHLQGSAAGVHYCLMLGGEIVAAATVGKRVIYGGKRQFELVRFCTRDGYVIPGGLQRLCSAAMADSEEASLVSYVDRRWFNGSSYLSSGFVLERVTEPGYWYVKGNARSSRFAFAKHLLAEKLEFFDPSLSEVENMRNNGWSRIFDCGQLKMRLLK